MYIIEIFGLRKKSNNLKKFIEITKIKYRVDKGFFRKQKFDIISLANLSKTNINNLAKGS